MTKQKFSELDIRLTIILVVVFVPLSLWGGAEKWGGVTDVLPFIMLFIGASFVIYESIKLCSPIIGAILGGLVPLVTIGPSLFLYPYEIGAFFISLLVGCLFGLIVSSICWFVSRRIQISKGFYTTQESELIEESNEVNALASRWQRLWASMIDTLIISLITYPFMYFTGGFDGIADGIQPPFGYSLFVGVIGIIVFSLFNGKLLIQNGQTIGKKVLGIKIVDLNGDLPTIKKHLLPRYATYFLPAQVPVVGPYISAINILFIFGKQKRCIHDYIAGTKVVES